RLCTPGARRSNVRAGPHPNRSGAVRERALGVLSSHPLTCDSLRRTRAGGRPPSALRAEGNRLMGMTNRRIRMLDALAAAAALALTAAPAAVAAPMAPGATFSCETGDIPSGSYGSRTA